MKEEECWSSFWYIISDNFDFIKDYCEKYVPQIHPNVPDATYLVWLDCRELGMSNEEAEPFYGREGWPGIKRWIHIRKKSFRLYAS